MHELWLLRHAEALPATGNQTDHARALSAHGQAQARALDTWLATQPELPDQVLCSSAARTCETAALMLAALPAKPPVTYLDAIYEASAGELLALATRHGQGKRVLLIGHNPGLSHLVMVLCANPAGFRGMTPATLVRMALDGPAEPGRGRLLSIYTG